MSIDDHKHYTQQAKRGIKGEAFFEALVCDYALPHHIVGAKDLGIDYVCQWVYGARPVGILFTVQVKTFSTSTAILKDLKAVEPTNGLDLYEIHNKHLNIDESTKNYWAGLGLPIYLFVIIEGAGGIGTLDCYYKRYTTQVTGNRGPQKHPEWYAGFHKVNDRAKFLAFKELDNRQYGFARDLFFDHVQCCYSKGSLMYVSPQEMGLNQFAGDAIFPGLVQDYRDRITETYARLKAYFRDSG